MPEKRAEPEGRWAKAKRWWAKIWRKHREVCLLLLCAMAGVALSAGALVALKILIVGDADPSSNPNPYQGFPWVLGLPFLTAPVLLRIWLVRFQHKEADLAIARDNASIAQKSERNQRYTTIVEQLGKMLTVPTGTGGGTEEKPHWDVRIGGLYALEKLMQEAPGEYHDIGINVLCAYVRNSHQFREDSPTSEQPAQEDEKGYRSVPDVRVALTILDRREERDGEPTVDLQRVDLERVELPGVTLKGADLSFANLAGADLAEANLTGAYLTGAHLADINLGGADLVDTTLAGATMVGANLLGADLTSANLAAATLASANLLGANLENANLESANLENVHLIGANLSGTNLEGANLKDADMWKGVNLEDANLARADLTGANLKDARIDRKWEGSEELKGTKGTPLFIDRDPDAT